MAKSVKTGLDLNKGAKLKHPDNFAVNNGSNRESLFDIVVRIIFGLLVAKRNSLLFRIKILNKYMNRVADRNDFRRMTDTVPGEFGYMNETVHAADVYESTEICKASYNTVIFGTDLDCTPDFVCLGTTLCIKKRAAGTGDTQTALVRIVLCDKNLNRLALVGVEIIDSRHLKLCAMNIDVNTAERRDNAVLNYVRNLNGYRRLILIGLFDLCLVLAEINMCLGEKNLLAHIGIPDASYIHFDLKVLCNGGFQIKIRIVGEFMTRNPSFRLIVDVYIDILIVS